MVGFICHKIHHTLGLLFRRKQQIFLQITFINLAEFTHKFLGFFHHFF